MPIVKTAVKAPTMSAAVLRLATRATGSPATGRPAASRMRPCTSGSAPAAGTGVSTTIATSQAEATRFTGDRLRVPGCGHTRVLRHEPAQAREVDGRAPEPRLPRRGHDRRIDSRVRRHDDALAGDAAQRGEIVDGEARPVLHEHHAGLEGPHLHDRRDQLRAHAALHEADGVRSAGRRDRRERWWRRAREDVLQAAGVERLAPLRITASGRSARRREQDHPTGHDERAADDGEHGQPRPAATAALGDHQALTASSTVAASSGRQIEQVGQPRVGVVVVERAPVEAAHPEPRGRGDRGRRSVVPLVLATGVGVDLRLAEHDGHGLRPGRAERDEVATDGLADRVRDERRAGAAHDHAGAAGVRRDGGQATRPRVEHHVAGRQRDGAGRQHPPDRERHVHRPVAAPVLAVLARAVEWVDDPHALRAQAGDRVDGLLREDRVARPRRRELVEDQAVGAEVALVTEAGAADGGDDGTLADAEQRLAGEDRDPRRFRVVVVAGESAVQRGHGGPR